MATSCGPLVDDIEDIITKDSHVTDLRTGNKKHVVPRARRVKTGESEDRTEVSADSVIPGISLLISFPRHLQGRIQDFWRGGSNLQRGVRFLNFTWFLFQFTHENEIIWSQRGVWRNPLNPLWISHWLVTFSLKIRTCSLTFRILE